MRHSSSTESRTDHPLYPEFILLRLLEQAGCSGLWVKNWQGRAFWTDFNTLGVLPPSQAQPFDKIEQSTGNDPGRMLGYFRLSSVLIAEYVIDRHAARQL
jgi:hypothetical protein